MRKLNILLTALMLGGSAFAASASELPPASTESVSYGAVLEGSYLTYASSMYLSWNGEEVSFAMEDPYFTLSVDGGEPTPLTNITLMGENYWETAEKSAYAVLSLGYLYTAGEYTISIPAGLVKNSAGDTNAAQDFTFTIVSGTLTTSDDNFKIEPPQSTSEYDYQIGGYPAPPFYKSSELSNVTISWDGIQFEPTGVGRVTAGLGYGNGIDITPYVTLENNTIKLDLSHLEGDGVWDITIPEGYIISKTEAGVKINATLYLKYNIYDNPTALDSYTVTNPRAGLYYVDYLNYFELNFGQPIMLKENAPATTYTVNGVTKEMAAQEISTDYSGDVYSLALFMTEGHFDNVTEPGLYTIKIPAGTVTNGTYDNEEIEFSYFIVATDKEYTTVPENESFISSGDFEGLKITFTGATSVAINDKTWQDIEVKGGPEYGNYTVNLTLDASSVSIDGNTVTIALPEVKQLKYWFSVPGKDFIIDDTAANDYIYVEFSVWDGLPAATILEAPGKRAPIDTEVLMTWGYQTVTKTEDFNVELALDSWSGLVNIPLMEGACSLVSIENPEGGTGTALKIEIGESLKAYLDDNYVSSPSFKLTVPAGIVENAEGALNPFYSIAFEAYPVLDGELQMAPYEEENEEGVFEKVDGYYIIYYPGTTWMSSITDGMSITVKGAKGTEYIINEDYTYNPTDLVPGSFGKMWVETSIFDNSCMVLNLTNLEEDIYTVEVPAGIALYNTAEISDDHINQAATFSLTVGDPQPAVTIENVEYTPNSDGSVDFTVEVSTYLIPAGTEAELYYLAPEATDYIAVEGEDNVFNFSIAGLEYNENYIVKIYAKAGDVTSETEDVEFSSYVFNPRAEVVEAKAEDIASTTANIVVTYSFTEYTDGAQGFLYVTNENTEVETKIAAPVDETEVTVELTDLDPETEYTFTVVAWLEGEEGGFLASSAPVTVTFTTLKTTGIEGVDADGNVRYFDLNGVELSNPQNGNIVIKVEGNRATKVVVK